MDAPEPSLIVAELSSLLSPAAVRGASATGLMDPGLDGRNLDAGLMVFPEATEDVAKVLAFCSGRGIAVVPQGGRSGLAGGAASSPGQVIVSLQRMNRILDIDTAGLRATVEAGVTLAALDAALEPFGLMAGIDLGARDSATIGGMISTNAGGIEAFRHGVMRARVAGLEAVLADGTVMQDMAQVIKCNEGYDIKQLLIGAEGTLGIVTKAVLRLVRRPLARATALIAASSLAAAIDFLGAIPVAQLLAFELMNARYLNLVVADHGVAAQVRLAEVPYYFVLELEGSDEAQAGLRLEEHLSEAMAQSWIADALIAKSEAERRVLWKLREDSWAVDRAMPGGLWYDVSVPLRRLDSYIAAMEQRLAEAVPEAQAFVIGHLGDGNIHVTIAAPSPLQEKRKAVTDIVYEGLKALGGAFSAEHGIGLEKRESLQRLGDPGKLAAMRAIKAALDPRGILNPGKVL